MKNLRIDFLIDRYLIRDVTNSVNYQGYKLTKAQIIILIKNQLYYRGQGFIIEPIVVGIDIELALNNQKRYQ